MLAMRLYTNPTDDPAPDTIKIARGVSFNENGTASIPCAITMAYVMIMCMDMIHFTHNGMSVLRAPGLSGPWGSSPIGLLRLRNLFTGLDMVLSALFHNISV